MSEQNPWKMVSTEVKYKNPWISVREDQVIRPDGKPGIYGVVETRLATGIVALTPNNEVYLVGQYRYPMEQYSWEIVEGGSEIGEDPLLAAKRELEEEAGLVATEWIQLGDELHLSNCHSNERGYVYLARGLKEVSMRPEGTEVLQVKKVPFTKLLEMIDTGEVKDGLTIVGAYRAERFLAGKNALFTRKFS